MNSSLIYAAIPAFLFSCQVKQNNNDVGEINLKDYPETNKDTTVVDTFFGTPVSDPYRWLENDTSRATAEWVSSQNEVTFDYLSQIPFRDDIRQRLEKLLNYEKFSDPFTDGEGTYFYKTDGLNNKDVFYRQTDESNKEDV